MEEEAKRFLKCSRSLDFDKVPEDEGTNSGEALRVEPIVARGAKDLVAVEPTQAADGVSPIINETESQVSSHVPNEPTVPLVFAVGRGRPSTKGLVLEG